MPEESLACPHCGKPARMMSDTEDSELLEIEVRPHRRRIRRRRYRATCTCDPARRTLTAPPAPKLVPKGNYGISIWAHVSLDNNASERALRGAALARKNFYGSGAFWSGRLAATMLSLLATLRHWKLSPMKWLTAYFECCAAAGGKAPDDIQPVISMHHRQGFPDAISFLSCSSALALTIYRGL